MAEEPGRQVNARRRVPENETTATGGAGEHSERTVGADEVEATRAEIEQTRAEMTETIDAIQGKLDPEKIKAQARTRATSTVRDTGTKAAETVKQNPTVPLAVGGGIALILLLRFLSGNRRSDTVVFDLKTGRSWRG